MKFLNDYFLNEILELFNYQVHIYEIIPDDMSKPIVIKIRANLDTEIAECILKNNIPILLKWEYKQDMRVKKWKFVSRYL